MAIGVDEKAAATSVRRLGIDHTLNKEIRRDAAWMTRKDQYRLKMMKLKCWTKGEEQARKICAAGILAGGTYGAACRRISDREIRELMNDLVRASGMAAAGVPHGFSLQATPGGSWPLSKPSGHP